MLIDSHCHIDFYTPDKQLEIIQNAKSEGVNYMLNVGSSRSSFDNILGIVAKYENVFGAIGQHPDEAETNGVISQEDLLKYISKNKKIIAIGETGLDYSKEGYNKDIQIENFLNHINVSVKTGLPIIIHNRDSNSDMCDILKSEMKRHKFKAIIHCFTGDSKMAGEMLELGFYISASGIITFKNAFDLRETFKTIPNDRLLVETDSPYLAPVPYRGRENQPAFVVQVAKQLSEIKEMDFSEIANITSNNFKQLFDLNI